MKNRNFVSHSVDKTHEIAQKIAPTIKNGALVCLYGDLGAGKTTFVQGLAKALGIEKRILSPSFVLMRSFGNFYHVDLYRINTIEEIKSLGLEEIWSVPKNIVVIEWAEKAKESLPKKRLDIWFEYLDEDSRSIKVNDFRT